MTGPEWDWLIEQSVSLGVPVPTYARMLLNEVAPIAQDREKFSAMRRALFEARQASFGWMRRVVDMTYQHFMENPEEFIPEVHRAARPEALASNPAWEEPDANR